MKMKLLFNLFFHFIFIHLINKICWCIIMLDMNQSTCVIFTIPIWEKQVAKQVGLVRDNNSLYFVLFCYYLTYHQALKCEFVLGYVPIVSNQSFFLWNLDQVPNYWLGDSLKTLGTKQWSEAFRFRKLYKCNILVVMYISSL